MFLCQMTIVHNKTIATDETRKYNEYVNWIVN